MKFPICSQALPYPAKEKQTYGWCTCGLSEKQPFCDGAHRGTGFKSLKHSMLKSETVYYCGCRKTKTPPFCDGSRIKE